jgi:mannose-6-phosphate isomerase-like protein (cupin superfamily)
MHLSTDLLTHGEFALAAGTHFEPADIHAGDEVYYVLSGRVHVHQPGTGQVVETGAGHVLHIPKGAPHISYNFGDEKVQILTFFAPRIWAVAEEALALDDAVGQVVVPGHGGWDGQVPVTARPPVESFRTLGHFPTNGPWSRDSGVITDASPEKALALIHGRQTQALLRIFVANDLLTVGTLTLPRNTASDVETHPGDEVMQVLKGRMSVELGPEEPGRVSGTRFELNAGEKLFLPAAVSHRYLNFEPVAAECVFAVAPEYGWSAAK